MDQHVTVLSFDDILLPSLLVAAREATLVDLGELSSLRYACAPAALEAIRERVRRADPRGVVLLGSGDFHYVTTLLLARMTEPFTLVLFDSHSSCLPSHFPDLITCDSWVSTAMALPLLEQVVLIGANPATVTVVPAEHHDRLWYVPYSEPPQDLRAGPDTAGAVRVMPGTIREQGVPVIMEEVISRIATDSIYISVDKCVLRASDAATNWAHGQMPLTELVAAITMLARGKRLIGMDITGEPELAAGDLTAPTSQDALARNQWANQVLIEAARREP